MPQIIYIDQAYYSIDGKKFSNGIDYIRYCRRVLKDKEPVLFTSFQSREVILKQSNSTIISSIGHEFIRLPYALQEFNIKLENLKPLNDIQLNDVVMHFCGVRSALRESFHTFKGRLRAIRGSAYSDMNKNLMIQDEFGKYKAEVTRDYGNFKELLNEFDLILKSYDPSNVSSVIRIESEQEERLSKYLPDEEDGIEIVSSSDRSWEVLFLDDKPDELTDIISILKSKGINYKIAETVDKAKDFISNDKYNAITIVVSDYRLLEKNNGGEERMQVEQGYDFLIWLAEQGRFNAMLALSGLSKWFLMDSFRKNKLNIKIYSKTGLLGGGAKLFVDDIEYLGDQYYEVLLHQARATNWTKTTYENDKIKIHSLKPYYIYHRNHINYLLHEDEINKQAEKLARELEYAIDRSSNFNFASMVSIQGNVTRALKGDFENEYEEFRLKLLQRRVFYYLLLKGFNKEAVAKMLHKGSSQNDMSDNMMKQIPSMLAIRAESDIPYGLLVEEKYFLYHFMQLPIFHLAELMNQAHSIINNYLSSIVSNNIILKQLLSKFLADSEGVFVACVSMNEIHSVIAKILKSNTLDNKDSYNLLSDIEQIISSLSDLLPEHTQIKQDLKKINDMKIKLAKKTMQ